LEETDFFLGLPVAQVALDVDGHLPPGRTFRQHIPLLTGEDVINFHPYGDAGIAISGEALLAIQALPLGSAKCGGRLFFVHSDNPEIMRYFAERFLEENKLAIHMAQQSGNEKMPEPTHKYRTLLVEMLLEALRRQLQQKNAGQPFSLTAYHLTNSGQGVDLNIYHFPNQVILYLREMLSATYSTAWKELVRRAWEITKAKRGEAQAPEPARNYLYEDLFGVAEDVSRNAPRFIRTYFMRQAFRFAKDKIDPRGTYSLQSESALVSWKLTEPFLRSIVHMETQRIENIRQMGDALAAYIQQQNDKRFFRNFYVIGRYDYLRNVLIKANTEHVKRGNKPFLALDSYISVFEEGDEVARADWRLARDLVLIRMVEQLYANGWLGANQDALPEKTTEEEEIPEQA
jgi:CRISPR-associated protein Cst1